MTSSSRHMEPDQPRWNYQKPVYKEYDTHCEPGLISILFLSCGRPEITRNALARTREAVSLYDGELEWILLEQGGCKENLDLFESLDEERKVIISQRNFGINNGLNQLWSLSRGEFCFVHENDWFNRMPHFDFLKVTNEIFRQHREVGIVHLRAVTDPNENWGFGKPEYNPWSCSNQDVEKAGIMISMEETASGHPFLISDFPNGFSNNPVIIRKSLYRECGPYPEPPLGADPRHGETLMQKRVADTGSLTAHIGVELYVHAGRQPTKAP